MTQDGRFNIDYDDGDVEKGVKRSNICSLEDEQALALLSGKPAPSCLLGDSDTRGSFSESRRTSPVNKITCSPTDCQSESGKKEKGRNEAARSAYV